METRKTRQPNRLRGLVDFWYARELPGITEPLAANGAHAGSSRERGLFRIGVLRALSIVRAGRSFDFISPNWYEWGRLVILVNSLLPTPRPTVLFEVIDYGLIARENWAGAIYRLVARYILGPAMRRTVSLLHVMTETERQRFIDIYRMDSRKVRCIAWPLLGWMGTHQHMDFTTAVPDAYVFSSGRAACDWANVIEAARGQTWKLVIVCGEADLAQVRVLNRDVGALLFCEVSKSAHDHLLAHARVCAISLKEERKSSGQVRLGAAIELGVATVATAVDGLKGYLLPGVNALAVLPGDCQALREGIGRLFNDSAFRGALVQSAEASCGGYCKADYFRSLRLAIEGLDFPAASSSALPRA